MTIFLKQVSQECADLFIVMQVDQASWHCSQHLQVPENRRLIFQPPYSPEINPVEHIWKELREKYFANRMFPSLADLQEHFCDSLNAFSSYPDSVRSLTYFPHIRVACETAT
jgi:hypothetical protein